MKTLCAALVLTCLVMVVLSESELLRLRSLLHEGITTVINAVSTEEPPSSALR